MAPCLLTCSLCCRNTPPQLVLCCVLLFLALRYGLFSWNPPLLRNSATLLSQSVSNKLAGNKKLSTSGKTDPLRGTCRGGTVGRH